MSAINISDSAIERIKEVTGKSDNDGKFLRISVDSGGCNGFQYIFKLDDKIAENDIKVLESGGKIFAVTDETSLPFLEGSELKFVKELGASYFKVENPNASSNCGCGSSFSV